MKQNNLIYVCILKCNQIQFQNVYATSNRELFDSHVTAVGVSVSPGVNDKLDTPHTAHLSNVGVQMLRFVATFN